jgi:hypothetical protein
MEREANMDPPIQTEYFRSGGAMILIFIVEGASDVNSFCKRSTIPGNNEEPPESTTLLKRSLRISQYHTS